MAELTGAAGTRLRDPQVRAQLARLDELLSRLEDTHGPTGELALDAVSELTRVYGEALARATGYAAESPGLLDSFVRDELLGHLLALHDIHPEPVRRRVARAIDRLRPEVAERGGDVTFAGIDNGVATVTITAGGGCGRSAGGIEDVVRQAVLAVAPELSDVAVVLAGRERGTAFVPLASLTVRPGGVPS